MPALETMRVLDFTQWEAGPTCGQYLGWLGADVVKLEAPRGDPGRAVFSDDGTDSQYFCNHNGNKRGLCLDLKSTDGAELLRRLLPRFDVLIENQGPGVIERLGFGPDVLHEINPSLIIARIKGFGLSGPYADYKSFDPLAMAASGVTSMTGTAESGPLSPGGTFADTGTGIHAAFAIAAAYVQQQRTGEGQVIELSMHEVMTMFIRTLASWSWGPEADPVGPRRDGAAPSGRWRCKPANGGEASHADYVFVTIASQALWATFCQAIERPELLDDERFARPRDRMANSRELRGLLAPWFAERTKREIMTSLGEAGVPVSAAFDTAEVFTDPHLIARDFFATLDHPTKGDLLVMKPPFRLSASDVPVTRAPLVGEHTREILAAELDLTESTIDELVEKGAAVDG
ncbi:MAG: CoA transferase [Acidimicrobiia bacterium]|nr:CoA transferase [Acidimicrobiia bacterium]